MKVSIIINLALLVSLITGEELPPQFSFNAQFGFTQWYNMGTLNEFEDMIVESYHKIDIPVKIVQSFPTTPSLNIQLVKHLSHFSVGLFYSKMSTGGRIHYEDYSGNVKVDYILKNTRYGLILEILIPIQSRFKIYQTMQLGVMPTNFELSEEISVWDNESTDKINVESIGYCIEPGFSFGIPVLNNIEIRAYFGANLIVDSEPYHLPNNEKATLNIDDNSKVYPDWIELKASVVVSIAF